MKNSRSKLKTLKRIAVDDQTKNYPMTHHSQADLILPDGPFKNKQFEPIYSVIFPSTKEMGGGGGVRSCMYACTYNVAMCRR